MSDWIVFIFVDVVFVAVLIVVMTSLIRNSHKDGFYLGVLMSFYWIENNTSCKDAIETYKTITRNFPDDGIFYCVKDKKGRIHIPKNSKLIIFESQK